jgi:hypothetical protein
VRLVAALEELEEARSVWLAYETDFTERRRKEKHDGLRRPGSVDDWHRMTWGGFGVAWCDDPRVHPAEPLAEVLRRLITALGRTPGSCCPVCGADRLVWRYGLDHEPSSGPVCTDCGILVPRPLLTARVLEYARRERLLMSA